MLNNFQLAAIVSRSDDAREILRIPMHQSLQRTLATAWSSQFDEFADGIQEVRFNAGYLPEEHECFVVKGFKLPAWLADKTSTTVASLGVVGSSDEELSNVRGIVGFARDTNGTELILFQNFNRSHVIAPGRFLLLMEGIYKTTEQPGLQLENRLSAVFNVQDKKLKFRNFRTVNTFLPLAEVFEEASEQQIRDVLSHARVAAVSVDTLAIDANQWFRKRFAMLRTSGVLDQYTPKEIQTRAKGYDVTVKIYGGKIVFPKEKPAAKKLLQFLNEELFRGAITEKLYETNSKRAAD